MNYKRGFHNLDYILKKEGRLSTDSDEYLNYTALKRQLRESIENEKIYAVLSPLEQERRERILREFDRISLLYTGKGFIDQCKKIPVASFATTIGKSHFKGGYALIIGVGAYVHSCYPDLPATVYDAEAIAATLTNPNRCGYQASNVYKITGEKATAENFRFALKKLKESTNDEATVIIYFSGHGGRSYKKDKWTTYLCTREADPNDLSKSAISGKEFSEFISAFLAQKLVIILDACHSSGSADFKAAKGSIKWKAGLTDSYYEALNQGSGRVIIASSRENQFSYIRKQEDLSVFTYHLCEAFNGKAAIRGDGYIRVLDLFHHVSEEVQKDKPQQTPILKIKESDLNFPIALALN